MNQQPETPWTYKPDTGAPTSGLTPNEAPEPKAQAAASPAQLSKTWQAPEFADHVRNNGWYAAFFMGTVVIAAVVYLTTKEIFAVATTIILAILAGILLGREPRLINCEATDQGLKVDGKLYEYRNFKSFAIIQEGQMTSISLLPLKRFMPPVSAYFDIKDQDAIVSVIGEHLPYEARQADAIDRLSHRLRF